MKINIPELCRKHQENYQTGIEFRKKFMLAHSSLITMENNIRLQILRPIHKPKV